MGDTVKFDNYVAKEEDFLKNINDILISTKQIKILEKYGININKIRNINELLYNIEIYLNNNGNLEDLEWVSESLAEYNYYANTNK